MYVVIETETGAQVLPRNDDDKSKVSEWAAHCAMDADLRNNSGAHRLLASKLHISMVEGES